MNPPAPITPAAEAEAGAFAIARDPRLRLLIPLVVAFAFFMEQLDSTIVATAIPDMARSLGTTALRMNLAITAYTLSLAVFIPISGWIADRYGTRRVFALALGVFTLGSMACGLSDSLPVLVATRVLQGFGGAMMTPVGRLILLRAFPRSELATAMNYMTVPAVIGPTLGPVLGGMLTSWASWRWIFYVNVPVGLVGIALALRFVEDSRETNPVRLDMTGFLLCGAGLALLQFALENLGHPLLPPPGVAAMAVAAAVLLALFAAHARRVRDAALDLSLFAIRSFRVGTLTGGLSRIGVNTVPFMLPLMLQVGFGLSPAQSGALTFATSLGSLAARPFSRRLLQALGFGRLLGWNALLCSLVLAGFALIRADTPHWIVFLYAAVYGICRNIQFLNSNTLAYADMPAAKLSRSTSLGGVLQQLTITFGVSLAATLLALIAGPEGVPAPSDFHRAFLLVALIPLASMPGLLALPAAVGAHVSHWRGPVGR